MELTPTTLQVVGLLVDILGAVTIASADIPFVNKRYKSGKYREGLLSLRRGKLSPDSLGYRLIIQEIEQLTEKELPEDIQLLKVGTGQSNLGGRDPRKVYIKHGISEPLERSGYLEGEFADFEEDIWAKIHKRESVIRGIGVIILSLGFILQIISLIYAPKMG